MMAIIVVAGVGAWPASYVVSSETSSLRLRSKTQGISWFTGGMIRCGFGVGFPYLYNADAANLGAKIGFVILGTSAFALLSTWALVPELKGKTAVEIDSVFERALPLHEARIPRWEKMGLKDSISLRTAESMDKTKVPYDFASLQSSNSSHSGSEQLFKDSTSSRCESR